MLKGERQNFHHSKLPRIGAVGYVVGLGTINPRRKAIVESFPLCDSANPRYSYGIHTCVVRFLDNHERQRISGIWFEALTEAQPYRRW